MFQVCNETNARRILQMHVGKDSNARNAHRSEHTAAKRAKDTRGIYERRERRDIVIDTVARTDTLLRYHSGYVKNHVATR